MHGVEYDRAATEGKSVMADPSLGAGAFFKEKLGLVPLTAAEREAKRRARKNARAAAKLGTVKEPTNASNSPELALCKGKSLDQEYAEDSAAERQQIRKTHDKLWRLTQVCAICGDTERETALKHDNARHEMHEDPSRAKTRGLPPAERFNIYICARVDEKCHKLLTDNVLIVHFHDEQKRWRSDYDVIVKATGQILRSMRRGELSKREVAE